jgi:hypothetical protein
MNVCVTAAHQRASRLAEQHELIMLFGLGIVLGMVVVHQRFQN